MEGEFIRMSKAAVRIHDPENVGINLTIWHEVNTVIEGQGISLHHFPLFDMGGAHMVFNIPHGHMKIRKCSELSKEMVRIRLTRDVLPSIMDGTGKVLIAEYETREICTWCSIPFKILRTGIELEIDCKSNQAESFWQTFSSLSSDTTSSSRPVKVQNCNPRAVFEDAHDRANIKQPMWSDLTELQISDRRQTPGPTVKNVIDRGRYGASHGKYSKLAKAKWRQQQLQQLKNMQAASGQLKVNEWLKFATNEDGNALDDISEHMNNAYQQQRLPVNKDDYWREDRAKTRWKVTGSAVAQKDIVTSGIIVKPTSNQHEYRSLDMKVQRQDEPRIIRNHPTAFHNRQPHVQDSFHSYQTSQSEEEVPLSISTDVPVIPLAGQSSSTDIVLLEPIIKLEPNEELPRKHWKNEKKVKRRGGALFDSI